MLPIKRLKTFAKNIPGREYDNHSNFHILFKPKNDDSAVVPIQEYMQRLGGFFAKKQWYAVAENVYAEGTYVITCTPEMADALLGDCMTGMETHVFEVPNPFDGGKIHECRMVVRQLSILPPCLRPIENGYSIYRLKLNPDCYGRTKLRVLNLPDLDVAGLERFVICATGRFPLISADYNESHGAYQVVIRYNDLMDATYAHYSNRKFTYKGKTITCRLEA